jgi:hypothetical protein
VLEKTRARSLTTTFAARIDVNTKAERAKDWVTMMRGYHAAIEEWRPVLKNMSKFSELFHPKTRDYIDWFIEAGGGLSQEMATADEQQLKVSACARARTSPHAVRSHLQFTELAQNIHGC